MKQKRAQIDESIFYIAGIVILFLFFAGLMLSIFLLSASNSKQNIEEAKISTLGTLTNFTFIITVLAISITLIIALINYILSIKKLNKKSRHKKSRS